MTHEAGQHAPAAGQPGVGPVTVIATGPIAREIASRLQLALSPSLLEVQDDSHLHAGHAGAREGGHFSVRLRCERFTGLTRVARHRLVYDSLGSLAALGVHALALDTLAPGEA